jgi:hypothetical protein
LGQFSFSFSQWSEPVVDGFYDSDKDISTAAFWPFGNEDGSEKGLL